jgi:hypothetical protein
MFRKAITPKRWQARPSILQCPHCHKLGHQGLCYPLPKDALCCHICGGNHWAADHTQKCSKAGSPQPPHPRLVQLPIDMHHLQGSWAHCERSSMPCLSYLQNPHSQHDQQCCHQPALLLMVCVHILFVNMHCHNMATHSLLNTNSKVNILWFKNHGLTE